MRMPKITAPIPGTKGLITSLKLLSIVFALLLAMGYRADAQQSSGTGTQPPPTTDGQQPSFDDDVHYDPVKITNGPVIENVTDTTAIIAWSTNVNSGTMLHYGENPDFLDKTGSMPWGGITHRVHLKNLKPGTKYYFQAESGQGQGTGTKATATLSSFQTR